MAEPDLHALDELVQRLGRAPGQLLPLLQAVQRHYRYLPPAALDRLSVLTGIPEADVYGVATFYSQFRLRPLGRHHVKVCLGTACHVKGAERVHAALLDRLAIPAGQDTSPDGQFTVDKVFCLGCCTLAPVVQIDDVTFAQLAADTVGEMIHDFTRIQERRREERQAPRHVPGPRQGEVRICLDSCCMARGCGHTHQALESAIRQSGLDVAIKRVACVVMCERAPMLEIVKPGEPVHVYSGVKPRQVPELLQRHFRPRRFAHRLRNLARQSLDHLLADDFEPALPCDVGLIRDPVSVSFFGPQTHVATEHYGRLDPLDLDEYRAAGGFAALARCLRELSPDQVVEEVAASGLRGRGGAGFPTARKWQLARQTPAPERFLICNGDEGDPGAFMDRMLLESFPYRVLEGILIAAYAIGARRGWVYVRAEYPFAVKRVRQALARLRADGLLGERLLGSSFGFELEVFEGAGAFVCGEETAMIASMEGGRGIPRLRPPYPAAAGLHGRPTLINNVETYAMLPWTLCHGGAALARLGTAASKGTKVFALAGRIQRGGLIEVPMGIGLRQIVDEIGGGVPVGQTLKAVLVGGPSGGCLPAALLDTPVDYEHLGQLGAIMGSGGLVVLSDQDCMVDVARYFLAFCQHESCGKCTFCRIGTKRLLERLDALCAGQAQAGDLERIEELAGTIKAGSLCGLGQTAPNPVLTALRYFRPEFEAHLAGRCPAGRCKALIRYQIEANCTGCTLCAQACPAGAIAYTPFQRHVIDQSRCTRCDGCRRRCPAQAVKIT